MSKTSSLYLASLEASAGSLIVSMGLMELLKSRYAKVAFFRPVIINKEKNDDDIDFMREHFRLKQSYEESLLYSVEEVEKLIAEERLDTLVETLISHCRTLEKQYDFILIQGLPRSLFSKTLDFDINLFLAKNLNAPFIPVFNAKNKKSRELYDEIKIEEDIIHNEGVSHFATFINRIETSQLKALKQLLNDHPTNVANYLLPENSELDTPSLREIKKALNAEMLLGDEKALNNVVKQSKIAAMSLEHYLPRLKEGSLVIVPADRIDIILASFVSFYAKDFPNIAGIILTGGLTPNTTMMQLLENFHMIELPIISVDSDTYETATVVHNVRARITAKSTRKIALAKGIFESCVSSEHIVQGLKEVHSSVTTPMMFTYTLFERARQHRKRIVLPESGDERILRAAEILLRRDIVDIILLGNREEIEHHVSLLGLDLSKATIIDPEDSPLKEKFTQKFFELRRAKGLSLDAARDAMVHPNYFATMMVHLGKADGMVSGAMHTTGDTIRPALQIIKTKETAQIVSSVFFMCLETRVLVYGDCAINLEPNAEELAQIAISSAETALLFGIEPRIAMLSYSTGRSGQGATVEKVRKATEIVKSGHPELLIEGPIQYDAAIDADVARTKLPQSSVAGQATIFIFPDLNTGNNTYKAVQRSAGVIAIGPVLQGLKKPLNDLSRGCSVDDIVNTVAVTAIQAQGSK
ncbi:phosphate acetyltransferase [Sulfurimonas sp. HSL3-7]|uniref:phosphate acetyltransferase n=1 Tax=Sulfonitrofixus jiaomeiensis TaxID=3131938 RepID=UPI0031F77209